MIPILTVGPFTVATHDAFSLLALAVGLGIYYAELRRRRWLEPRIFWISLAAVLGGVLGARVITAWEHLEYYAALDGVPLGWAIEHSGKSLIGALAGGFLATVAAKRALGYTRSTGDAYVLAIPVATIIGRIGCFLSELPWGRRPTCHGASPSRHPRRRRSRAARAAPCPCTHRCSTRSASIWSPSPSSCGSAIASRSPVTPSGRTSSRQGPSASGWRAVIAIVLYGRAISLGVGWSKCFLRRPSYIIAFWLVVAIADAYRLFVAGQRLPGG